MSCSSYGPCDVQYEDPLFSIPEIEVSNNPPSQIDMLEIQKDGQDVPQNKLMTGNNLSLVDDTLRCTIPCSFGRDPGNYFIKLTAPGYEIIEITIEGEYNEVEKNGPCPQVIHKGSKEIVPTFNS